MLEAGTDGCVTESGRAGFPEPGKNRLYWDSTRLMDTLTLPLDYQAIERILPHRYPFLLVDRITEFDVDKRIVGIKNVSPERASPDASDGEGGRCCRRRS